MMGGGLGTKWDRWEVVGRGFGKMENDGNGSRGGGANIEFFENVWEYLSSVGESNMCVFSIFLDLAKNQNFGGRRH